MFAFRRGINMDQPGNTPSLSWSFFALLTLQLCTGFGGCSTLRQPSPFCPWRAEPETRKIKPMSARLHFPTVDDTRCQVCTPCEAAAVCKVRAIVRIDPGEPPIVNLERCYDCRLCLPACPYGALGYQQPGAGRV